MHNRVNRIRSTERSDNAAIGNGYGKSIELDFWGMQGRLELKTPAMLLFHLDFGEEVRRAIYSSNWKGFWYKTGLHNQCFKT